MPIEFTNTTPKILIYTDSDMGDQLVDYLSMRVAILDHLLDAEGNSTKLFENQDANIEWVTGSIKEEKDKYDVFFCLGEKSLYAYLGVSDTIAKRTFYIDVEGTMDLTELGIMNAEPIQDNTVEELWDRCCIDSVELREIPTTEVEDTESVIEKELDDLLKTNPLGELHLDASDMYDDLVKDDSLANIVYDNKDDDLTDDYFHHDYEDTSAVSEVIPDEEEDQPNS